MGKISLIITGILVVLNTLAGLVFSSYEPFNFVFSDISILLTGGLLYLNASSKASDGFKIGLFVILCITGTTRFFMAVFSGQGLENNVLLLVFVSIVAIEAVLYLVANYMKKIA